MIDTKESIEQRKKRTSKIVSGLRKLYPEADCALGFKSPLELLIATILSAQSTDETVNKVTPVLFRKYKTAKVLASAPPDTVEEIIHSTGFFRQKTKSIQSACRKIVEEFDGQVPQTMEELISLPGVARKTANVVLGTAFGKAEGIVVDTHIGRLATRLALTWSGKNEKDAVKIEQDLMQVLPKNQWIFAGHALIWHGRRVCSARKPDCPQCTLAKLCPSVGSFDVVATQSSKRTKKTASSKAAKRS